MIVVTIETVPGRKILRTLGLVKGNTVRAGHAGEDIVAFLKNLVGGEVTEYTQIMAEARDQALDRMVEEARNLGANAIVGLHFSSASIVQHAAEIMAYGTAVILEEAGEDLP
jgi:uncharacterized protein YbjQ (UPF0145 family)